MSVFFKNICPHNCNKEFRTLSDLILHIEAEHIDFDRDFEEKPDMVPLSYILRYGGDSPQYSPQEIPKEAVITEPNYLEISEEEARLIGADFSQVLGENRLFTFDKNHSRPFMCNMVACEKRYKNLNGIKYHYKKHHKMVIPGLKKNFIRHKPLYAAPDFYRNDLSFNVTEDLSLSLM